MYRTCKPVLVQRRRNVSKGVTAPCIEFIDGIRVGNGMDVPLSRWLWSLGNARRTLRQSPMQSKSDLVIFNIRVLVRAFSWIAFKWAESGTLALHTDSLTASNKCHEWLRPCLSKRSRHHCYRITYFSPKLSPIEPLTFFFAKLFLPTSPDAMWLNKARCACWLPMKSPLPPLP